jgi:hypothetical protein
MECQAGSTLGVPWHYEPEGFTLSTGEKYLPDFLVELADGPLWCEVKPKGVFADKFDQFLTDMNRSVPPQPVPLAQLHHILIRGTILHEIPAAEDIKNGCNDGDDFLLLLGHGDGDNCYQFCVCPGCQKIGFQFEGRVGRVHCGCDLDPANSAKSSDRICTYAHPHILKAYQAARAARFEFGE